LQGQRLLRAAASAAGREDAGARLRAGTRAYLTALAEQPELAQTLIVEIVGAGPRAAARRVSRQVRLGIPEDVLELAPVIDRLIGGVLAPGSL
jgi:hypothetical protein